MKRLFLLLVLLAPQDKTTLRVAWTPPRTLDPMRGANLNDARVLAAVFEGLVTYEADLVTPAPGAAENWDVSSDGLTYTFTLRDAKWSDGEPVVASDFVSAWRRAFEPGSFYAPLFDIFKNARPFLIGREADGDLAQFETLGGPEKRAAAKRLLESATKRHAASIKALAAREKDDAARALLEEAAKTDHPDVGEEDIGFKAIDPKTVRCVLERPTAQFLDLLGFMPFYPVSPKTAVWTDWRTVPTNGPYKIATWDRYAATLARVRGDGPEKLIIEWRDPADALKVFDQGRLDWLDGDSIPPGRLAEIAKRKDFVYFDLWATAFLRINAAREPFGKADVRRAFAYAIDRRALVEAVRCNGSDRLVPPGFPGYPDVAGLAFSKSKAFECLLKEFPDTTKFPKVELLVVDAPRDRLAAESLRDLWEKNLGIAVKLRVMKGPAYAAVVASGEYQMALGAWAGDTFDPMTFLDLFAKGGPRNCTGWSSDAYDRLLAAARGEGDAKKRSSMLAEAERLLLADAAVVPLYTLGSYYLVNARVRGVTPNLMGRVLLQHIRL